MTVTITKSQVDEIIDQVVEFQKKLDLKYPDDQELKYVQSYKEFLVDRKTEELIDQLMQREREFKIEVLVVENGNESIFNESDLLLEWEQYKKIPKTNLIYRYDKGEERPGMEDHIHVYLGNTRNQVYAINRTGAPHDGSKAKLSNKEIKFLKSIGFTPPENGILEWITLRAEGLYSAYRRILLFD